ncbi:MAG: peptidylprolyl isomerase [Cyanobacteria bacterium P01_F01_bin.42]
MIFNDNAIARFARYSDTKLMNKVLTTHFRQIFKRSAVLLAGLVMIFAIAMPAYAGLPPGNPIRDPEALLRLGLPIPNEDIRDIQLSLEDLVIQARSRRWSAIKSTVGKAQSKFKKHQDEIIKDVVEGKREEAEQLLESIISDLEELKGVAADKDIDQLRTLKTSVMGAIGQIEAAMVSGFPFEIPEEYKDYPQLLGHATIDMQTSQGELTIVVDGFNAPLTAGNFVDLVQRKFYDGLPFIRSEESYVVQAGDPPGDEVGFINPKTKKYRAIPLEIRTEEDNDPLYGVTFEEAGLYQEQPRLPFSSYGAIALAHGDDPNDGSSQFFFHLYDSELTPAGSNFLDGSYALFGYVTKGQEVLGEISEDDTIVSAKVTQGLDNFVKGKV